MLHIVIILKRYEWEGVFVASYHKTISKFKKDILQKELPSLVPSFKNKGAADVGRSLKQDSITTTFQYYTI